MYLPRAGARPRPGSRCAVAATVIALLAAGTPAAHAVEDAIPDAGEKFLIRTTFLGAPYNGAQYCLETYGSNRDGGAWIFFGTSCDRQDRSQMFRRSPDGSELKSVLSGKCIEDTPSRVVNRKCGTGRKRLPLTWRQDGQGHVSRKLPNGSTESWILEADRWGNVWLKLVQYPSGTRAPVLNAWNFLPI